ncbi:MAG: hypothetical protein ACWA6X_05445 [Bauldia sp.]
MDYLAGNLAAAEVDTVEEAERLLKRIAEARDEALRLKLALTARLLDMACLDVSAHTSNRK